MQRDSLQMMIELNKISSGFVYDLRYATKNNFTGKKLYASREYTFLRQEPALALCRVKEELKNSGLGIKVFDAYRPYHVTRKMWDLIGDERYVANPKKGSGHNRGLAVDLTLIRLSDSSELDMGTGFDNFTDSAHQDFDKLPVDVLENRRLLKEIMEKYGFKPLATEWWHFSWPNDRNYDVLDIKPEKFLLK